MKITTLDDFKTSISESSPPDTLSVYSQALWWAGKGEWDRAHDLVQNISDASAAWIHAYLHRVEGDLSNAQYWYAKAGVKMPSAIPSEEWENMVLTFIRSDFPIPG